MIIMVLFLSTNLTYQTVYAELDVPTVSTIGHIDVGNTPLPLLCEYLSKQPSIESPHTTTDYNIIGNVPGLDNESHIDEIVIFVHGQIANESVAMTGFKQVKNSLEINSYEYQLVGFSWKTNNGICADLIKANANLNGPKLAQFIQDLKNENPDVKIHLIGYSMGARVVLMAIQDLNAEPQWNHKITSVHLLGAGVDTRVVGTDECIDGKPEYEYCFGKAIQNVVGEFHNKFNGKDLTLLGFSFPFQVEALGVYDVDNNVTKPANYHSENVTDTIGTSHNYVIGGDDGKNDGIIDNVIYDWRNPSSPTSGDWYIFEDMTIKNSITAPGNVIVSNDSILTINNNASLDVDLVNHSINVESGSGILIKSGSKIH